MQQNALYALLTPQSNRKLREMLGANPMPLLPETALFIGDTVDEIEVMPDVIYTGILQTFELITHPFTGNPCLVLTIAPEEALQARREHLGKGVMTHLPMFIPMSDRVDMAMPRHYKTWLQSIESSLVREHFECEFYAEFVVPYTVWTT